MGLIVWSENRDVIISVLCSVFSQRVSTIWTQSQHSRWSRGCRYPHSQGALLLSIIQSQFDSFSLQAKQSNPKTKLKKQECHHFLSVGKVYVLHWTQHTEINKTHFTLHLRLTERWTTHSAAGGKPAHAGLLCHHSSLSLSVNSSSLNFSQ